MAHQYFLGVDIGQTKSHAVIADQKGCVLGRGLGGPGARKHDDYSIPKRVVNEIVTQALDEAGLKARQIAGAGFGIAGFDFACHEAPHRQIIDAMGLGGPAALVNDGYLGIPAGIPAGWGISLSAGTYAHCWGRDPDGKIGRVAGGWHMGDHGGAGQMVYWAKQAVAAAWSRKSLPTALTETLIAHFGAANADDLIEGLSTFRYVLLPIDAPLIFEVAAGGDLVAQSIVDRVASELGRLVLGVCNQLDFSKRTFQLVLAGSLFNAGPPLTTPVRAVVIDFAPLACLVRLKAPPVMGGVILGMQAAKLDPRQIESARAALLEAQPVVVVSDCAHPDDARHAEA